MIDGLDDLLDPAADGYGIAAGPDVPPPHLGTGGPGASEAAAYEEALFGSALAGAEAPGRDAPPPAAPPSTAPWPPWSRCPTRIGQLEADAAAHPAWVAALGEWSACMAERGYSASSPEDLIAAQTAALALASGDDRPRPGRPRAGGGRRRLRLPRDAPSTRPCEEVAAALAPAFVERNRPQLAALIPPPGRRRRARTWAPATCR